MHKEDQKKPTLKVGESPDLVNQTQPEGEESHAGGTDNHRTTAGSQKGSEVPPSTKSQTADVYIDDRYEVLEFIGEGGMGSVYKVKDRVLEKVFAVKLVKPELLKDNTAMKRFEQEAQSAISLTHPNLVSVYGHKLTTSGQPFLLMDYHPGSSLSEMLIKHGKIGSGEAVDLFALLSDALTHAHTKGIIHRDLKPSNIIIEQNEMGKLDPKIVDFGISKILSSNFTTMGFTKEQQIIGSPHYMSPEMCRGDKLDARSDVYSLGCVMFEVVEGRPPYQMENPFQTLMQHVGGELPKFSQPSAVPPPLQGIILKCLAKNPADRYQSMEELRRDLERFKLGQKLVFAKPKKSRSVKPAHLIIAGGALACFATGVLLTYFVRTSVTPEPAAPPTPVAPAPTASANSNAYGNLLTWDLPEANPNDPESLIRRLEVADEQSDLRSQLLHRTKGEPYSYEQRNLREQAASVLEKQTQTALTAMGERVIPTLLNHCFDESRRVRTACFRSIKDLGAPVTKPFVDKLMNSGKSASDTMSANAVGEIGKPAIVELMKYVAKGGDSQNRALQFLLVASTRGGDVSIEMSDVPALARVVNSNTDTMSKKLAMLILVTVADRSDAAKDLFTKIAQDQNADSDLRVTAISALGTIANTESGDASPSTQTVLQRIATTDKDAYIRFAATSNIGALGPKAKASSATIKKLMKDRDGAVSMAAKAGLGLIDGAVVGERGSMSTRDIPTFVGEINSSISQEKVAEKIRLFGGALSNSPFYTLPTHPDFCGFTIPVLMNYIDKAGDHFSDKRYAYETLTKTGHYSSPATAWVVLKASRDSDRWGQTSASGALMKLVGINQRY